MAERGVRIPPHSIRSSSRAGRFDGVADRPCRTGTELADVLDGIHPRPLCELTERVASDPERAGNGPASTAGQLPLADTDGLGLNLPS